MATTPAKPELAISSIPLSRDVDDVNDESSSKRVDHLTLAWKDRGGSRYDEDMPGTVLMCPPTFFEIREIKNPHMGAAVDRVRAQKQWENLRRVFDQAQLKVEIIDPVENLEDMVFTANQVFVCPSSAGKFVVPSRMRYSSRQPEVAYFVDWFRRHEYKVVELDLSGEYLEGHGDLLWHPDNSRVWAGFGFRTSSGAVERFAEKMQEFGIAVTPLELVDAHFYHLDTCFCPLNEQSVLIYPGAFSSGALADIRQGFARVYEITREEGIRFIANAVVANGCFITSHLTDNLCRVLTAEGLSPLVVDTSEFEKSGGSVFCMKNVIE